MRIKDKRTLRSAQAGEVRWTKGFCADRFAVCRDAMVPNMWRLLSDDALCHAFAQKAFATPTPELAHHTVCPSHYMGAIDLYRLTGDQQWLALAETWLASRDLLAGGSDDNQTRVPVQEQEQAVGHAVRANYLYAGLTDLCIETDNTALLSTIEKVWEDVASRKVYITGACGVDATSSTYPACRNGFPSLKPGRSGATRWMK
ncbi:MAG TPA: hypothetical protein EYQ18_14655 [Candidatus Handelsmanbacteria bacterium]|nr:hypothetical protein [Candidatus Handelsmanbacteria bacterium]